MSNISNRSHLKSSTPKDIRPTEDVDLSSFSSHLEAEQVEQILRDNLTLTFEQLLFKAAHAAASYAIVPISWYHVGAAVAGMRRKNRLYPAIYMGANVEFSNQALSYSVHAEQSAISHAWLRGEKGIRRLAVTAAPCGYCRQFIKELSTSKKLKILLKKKGIGYTSHRLKYYLPFAFGPNDLGISGGLMDPKSSGAPNLVVEDERYQQDKLVQEALRQAKASYAPYSGNFSDCAIQAQNDTIYGGRYAENAAYNPSMSPLESAISFMNMSLSLKESRAITRAVLVELPGVISQLGATQNVLSAFAPDVTLEYVEAKPLLLGSTLDEGEW